MDARPAADGPNAERVRRALRSDDPPDLVVRRRNEIVLDDPLSFPQDRRRPRLRAVVADVQAVTRHGMRALLALCDGVDIVAEASSGLETLGCVLEQAADLVVIDLDMADLDGIQVTRRIRQESPATRVVILSAGDSEESVVRAMQAGASGYLSKSAGAAEFQAAVESARVGGVYLDTMATGAILAALERRGHAQGTRRPRPGELTDREVEIARLMAEGLTARRIASALGISDRTVNSHMGNLYRRLSVNNRVDAVRELMRLGIAPAPR